MRNGDIAANERLRGKTAIVTGGGRGIGRGIALLLAREGARVVVADNGGGVDGTGHDASVAEQAVREIEAFGGTAIAATVDVADWTRAGELVAGAIAAWGQLDILVNVAGNMHPCTVVDVTEESFNAVIRVHLNGTMNTSHFAALHWTERKRYGRLINFASPQAHYGHPLMLNYTAAKAGIIGLTRSCANALVAYGVTANAIIPTAATRMVDAMDKEALRIQRETGTWRSASAAGTLRDPAHVAPMVAFLASERAGHISGRVFGAHGGRYTRFSEPSEECDVRLTWPDDYAAMFDEFDRTLGANVRLEDLAMPLPSVDADWSEFGGRPPRWDFTTRP